MSIFSNFFSSAPSAPPSCPLTHALFMNPSPNPAHTPENPHESESNDCADEFFSHTSAPRMSHTQKTGANRMENTNSHGSLFGNNVFTCGASRNTIFTASTNNPTKDRISLANSVQTATPPKPQSSLQRVRPAECTDLEMAENHIQSHRQRFPSEDSSSGAHRHQSDTTKTKGFYTAKTDSGSSGSADAHSQNTNGLSTNGALSSSGGSDSLSGNSTSDSSSSSGSGGGSAEEDVFVESSPEFTLPEPTGLDRTQTISMSSAVNRGMQKICIGTPAQDRQMHTHYNHASQNNTQPQPVQIFHQNAHFRQENAKPGVHAAAPAADPASGKRKRAPSLAGNVNGINSLIPRQQSAYPSEQVVRARVHDYLSRRIGKSSCTLSTLTHVGSTFDNPSLAEILAAVSIVLHCQMGRDSDAPPERRHLLPFDEEVYTERGLPDVRTIYIFLEHVFQHGLFSPECALIALIYLNRLLAHTQFALTARNYRAVYMSALCLGQKMHDDSPLVNVDFQLLYPMLTRTAEGFLPRFNYLEKIFLNALDFNLNVPLSLYASYYFECRAICAENAFQFVRVNRSECLDKEESEKYDNYIRMQKEKRKQLQRKHSAARAAARRNPKAPLRRLYDDPKQNQMTDSPANDPNNNNSNPAFPSGSSGNLVPDLLSTIGTCYTLEDLSLVSRIYLTRHRSALAS